MNWWPLIDVTLVTMLAIGSLVVFLIVILPPALLLDWWLKSTPQGSPFRKHLTFAGYVFILFFGFILLAGLLHRGNAARTLLGDLVGSQLGWVYFMLILWGVAYVAEMGLRRIGIYLGRPPRPWWDDPHPAAVWTPQEEDGELAQESAFAIEFQNDDQAHLPFLLSILRNGFGMELNAAYQEMIAIHQQGIRAVGWMSRANADALLQHIQAEASKRGIPLRCQVVQAPAGAEA